LLDAPGINVNQAESTSGTTPLHMAACQGHDACVRLLLGAPGINVNQPESTNGRTSLYMVASWGHETCVRLLLDAPGINVNQPESTNGMTPLYMASLKGHETCVRLLLDAPGIDVNQADSTHARTPLHTAALNGNESCVEILLAAPGIDVNCVSLKGQNVLVCAFSHVMISLRQVGSGDTTRILVRLLASRQVSSQALSCAISFLHSHWLTNTQVAEVEDSGQALTKAQEATRLLLPVLRAQSTGERRWCGWCWALTPDFHLFSRHLVHIG
jgi:hypothetical protein